MPINKGIRYVALYERLSRDDELQGESNSITNQKEMLESYARANGFTPFRHFFDDGISGTTFERDGFKEMIAECEKGNISAVIVKDLSRFGRDYLTVGLYTDVFFPEHDIRFIAIGNSIDSTVQGNNDFAPMINLMNEWYARDTSRKIQAVFKSRMQDGKRVSPSVPYGYLRDPDDKQKLIIDEEPAQVARRIFDMIIAGKSVSAVARTLTEEKILIPSAYAEIHYPENCHSKCYHDKYYWTPTTIGHILEKREYMGDTVLGKSVSVNFKTKKHKQVDKDELMIFENTHPAIVDREKWELAQKTKRVVKRTSTTGEAPHALSGLMYCADCGRPLNKHINRIKGKEPRPSDYCFVCFSYRNAYTPCTMHYIKMCDIEEIVLERIQAISAYATENEKEFIESVSGLVDLQQSNEERTVRSALSKASKRIEELNVLIKKLYEANALGKIPDDHFNRMFAEYDTEQKQLQSQVKEYEKSLSDVSDSKEKANRFMRIVRKYSNPKVLTAALANEFIEKIIVHEAIKENGPKCRGCERRQKVEVYFNFIGQISDVIHRKAETAA
ncbi:MAG: recombinase family protein [Ruminiclostridium sp.]|nr:recombinase family protein [Ruminiclostridium sp.]